MRRLALLTTVVLLAMALPAAAKMPPFEMEVEPRGDTVHIEVTITGDKALIHEFDPLNLDGLLAVFPADQVDEEGRPRYVLEGGTGVGLSRVAPGSYEGNVPLEPGNWAVVPFPGVTSAIRGAGEGWYPRTVLVEVSTEQTSNWVWAAVGAAIALAIASGLRLVVGRRFRAQGSAPLQRFCSRPPL